MNPDVRGDTFYCSFCGKDNHETRKLIAGPTVFICDECIWLCIDIIEPGSRVIPITLIESMAFVLDAAKQHCASLAESDRMTGGLAELLTKHIATLEEKYT